MYGTHDTYLSFSTPENKHLVAATKTNEFNSIAKDEMKTETKVKRYGTK